MHKGRGLGLIGGLAVRAAIHYYEKLAEAHQQHHVSMDFVMVHAETSRVFAYVQAGDREGLTSYLTGFIHRLKAAGAEFAVIPAVTPHFCIRHLLATSPLPLFNIFDPLTKELAARSSKRVAVFGTRFVMDSGLFGMISEVEIVHAHPDERDSIDRVYLELVRQGKGSEEQYRNLSELARTLCSRDRVDTILLAGTDLTLLFNETNTDFPHIDCAALHLRAIIRGLFDEATSA
jgi:aspartate racemase